MSLLHVHTLQFYTLQFAKKFQGESADCRMAWNTILSKLQEFQVGICYLPLIKTTEKYQNFVALEGTLDNLHANYHILTFVEDCAFLFRLSSHIMM